MTVIRELNMAGAIRHPIDVEALHRYIENNVPEIKTPVEVKQVRLSQVSLIIGS